MPTAAATLTSHQKSVISPGLVALRAPGQLSAQGELPKRIVMLKWGDNETAAGNFRVGLKTLQASKLWDGMGYGRVAIDFNHNSVEGHPAYRGEPVTVAGHATPRVIDGEGLIFEDIEWTAAAQEHRESYPDLSPAIKPDEDGEVIFCHSAALARNGAVPDLHLFSAASIPADLAEKLVTLMADPLKKAPATHKPGTSMLDTELLKKLLKLPADATDDDINTALAAFAKAEGEEDKTEGDGGDAKAGDAPKGDVTALSAVFTKAINTLRAELTGRITTLTARLDGQEREAIIAEAASTGRIVPKEWLPDDKGEGGLPNSQLRTLCATLPEVVPLSRRTPANVRTLSADTSAATAAEREVMRVLNISAAAFKKHNAA